jgi:hypothetical protein
MPKQAHIVDGIGPGHHARDQRRDLHVRVRATLVSVMCSATSRGNLARSASTGTTPAHDTRFGSSNTAAKPWETRIYRVPFRSQGIFPSTRSILS